MSAQRMPDWVNAFGGELVKVRAAAEGGDGEGCVLKERMAGEVEEREGYGKWRTRGRMGGILGADGVGGLVD